MLVLLTFVGQGCTKGPNAATQAASRRIELNVWSVVDDSDVYDAAFVDYRHNHPNIQINYRRLRLEEYESELLNALAEDRGPDIFLIHHDAVGKYLPKIVPMPATTKIAYSVLTGTIKKEQTWELRSEPTITLKAYKEQFADAAIKDTLRRVNVSTVADKQDMQERLMAMPISIDTMALYYNKDLLNAAGIPTPPSTWTEFQDQAKKLIKLDAKGNIVQAVAGIGTSRNVERSTDLITALMVQNGTQMFDPTAGVTMAILPPELEGKRDIPPAQQALEFYTDFANPAKETYTWNDTQSNSMDAFIEGRAAFFFGYAYQNELIRARAPKLNLGISALPQIEGNPIKNVANYWVWAVSKKSKNTDVAWNLLNFMGQPEEAKKVLAVMKRPAARKALLVDQLNDEQVGVFASQVLTAVTWYTGNNVDVMEEALMQMIDDVVKGGEPISTAIRNAADKINQTISFSF